MATKLTINTDTVARMADAIRAKHGEISKNTILGSFAQAMMGPGAHWGALKSSPSPVIQPGLNTAPGLADRMPDTIYVCAGSHDWNDFRFTATDERAFRETFRDDQLIEIEQATADDKFKSLQFFCIDPRTGDTRPYVASPDAILELIADKAIMASQPCLQPYVDILAHLTPVTDLERDGYEPAEYLPLEEARITLLARERHSVSGNLWEHEISLREFAAIIAAAHDRTDTLKALVSKEHPETAEGNWWYIHSLLIQFERKTPVTPLSQFETDLSAILADMRDAAGGTPRLQQLRHRAGWETLPVSDGGIPMPWITRFECDDDHPSQSWSEPSVIKGATSSCPICGNEIEGTHAGQSTSRWVGPEADLEKALWERLNEMTPET